MLNSYTKAINKANSRVGSLFQQHSNSNEITDDKTILNVISYIHKNPLRKGLVSKIDDWEFSSYKDYTNSINNSFINKDFYHIHFNSVDNFKFFFLCKTEKFNFIFDLGTNTKQDNNNLETTSKVESK